MSQEDEKLINQNLNKTDDGEDSILSDLDFIRFLIVAQKNLHWILLFFVVCLGVSYMYLRYTKSIYQSKSLIKYDIKQMSPAFNQDQASMDNYAHLAGEIEFIKSNVIYEQVIKALPIEVSYFAYGRINNMERYNNSPFTVKFFEIKNNDFFNKELNLTILEGNAFQLQYNYLDKDFSFDYNFGDIIETKDFKLVIGKNGDNAEGEIEGKYFFIINSKEALQNYLASKVEVKIANADAKTIEIAFSDFNNVKIRDIVSTIDSVYMSETILKKNRAQEQSIAFMNEQLRMTEENLEQYERKIERFTKENKTPDIKAEFSKYLGKAETETVLLDKLNVQLEILNKLQTVIYKGDSIEKIMPLLYLLEDDNQQLQAEAEKLFALQSKMQQISATSKEKTFALKSIKSDLANTRDVLIDHLIEYKKMLEDDIQKTKVKVKDYENVFSVLPSKETEFTKIKRFYNLYEKFYLMLIDRKAEYGILKAGTVPEFQILKNPSISNTPVSPNVFQIYFIGIACAFFLSFFLIVVQYFLHNTINNIGELEKLCLAPTLGYIPNFNGNKLTYSKLVVNEYPKSPVSESLRSIRTNMEFMSRGKNNKVISITSTISGEGKTFVAINLGGIIAMTGQKVVILDLDLRKPKISKAFDGDNKKGISTVLIGRSEYLDSIQNTSIPTYYFMPSGPVPPNPSELIMSKEFDDLLEKLKSEFDYVIIDTPPVGIVTDGILAMKKSDLNIYVVRAEYSKKGFERSLNNLVSRNNFKNLAVVLNGFDNLRSYAYGYKYGYGQGYGYGDYYQLENDKSKRSILKRIKKFFKA